jgi:hypothetical protein
MLGLTMPLCSDNGEKRAFRLHYAAFGPGWQAGFPNFSLVKSGTAATGRPAWTPWRRVVKKRGRQCDNPG